MRNKVTFKTAFSKKIELGLWGEPETWMTTEIRYMYEVLGRKAAILKGITNWLGMDLKEKYFSKESVFTPFEKISFVGFNLKKHHK